MPNWAVVPENRRHGWQSPDYYPDDGKYWFFRQFAEEWSVDVLDAASWYYWASEERFLRFYLGQGLQALRHVNRYDLVFAFGSQSAVALLGTLRCLGLPHPPVVVDDAGCLNAGHPEKRLSFQATRWALEDTAAVIWHATASRELCTRACPRLAARGTFVPLGINDHEFLSTPTHDGGYALCTGYAQRGWPTLLDAWRSLPGVPLKLLGAPLRQAGLPPGVTVLPRMSFPDYRDLVAGARVVVLPVPDGWASWGQMTLLQAMALGKPVVVTQTKPVRDYLSDEWCVPVPPEDPAALAQGVQSLWNDPCSRDRLGKAARQAVTERFSERQMARRFEDLLLRVLRRDAVTDV